MSTPTVAALLKLLTLAMTDAADARAQLAEAHPRVPYVVTPEGMAALEAARAARPAARP